MEMDNKEKKLWLNELLNIMQNMIVAEIHSGLGAVFIKLGKLVRYRKEFNKTWKDHEFSLYIPLYVSVYDADKQKVFEGWALNEDAKMFKALFQKRKIKKLDVNKKDHSLTLEIMNGSQLRTSWSGRGEFWGITDRRQDEPFSNIGLMKSKLKARKR